MKYLKSYENVLNEELRDFDEGFELKNILANISDDPRDPNYLKILEIAKKGELYKCLATGQKQLTFGMLKALYRDAIEFKKNRELRQGIEKCLWRIIPIIFAPVFFPIWLVAQFLGATRAFDKVMFQVLKMKNKTYHSFLMNILDKIFEFSEGEIERLMVDDWFYRSFAIEQGLIKMVKRNYMVEFCYYIIKKIEHQNDQTIVSPYFVDNEFRKWLNRKFKFDPPLPLKTKCNKHEKFAPIETKTENF